MGKLKVGDKVRVFGHVTGPYSIGDIGIIYELCNTDCWVDFNNQGNCKVKDSGLWNVVYRGLKKVNEMTKADLHREYARVIDMCVGAKLEPLHGVKYLGKKTSYTPHVSFNHNPEDYEFARGIVEGEFVFDGDIIYTKDGDKITIHSEYGYEWVAFLLSCPFKPDWIETLPRICRVWDDNGCSQYIRLVVSYNEGHDYCYKTDGASYKYAEPLTDEEVKQYLKGE